MIRMLRMGICGMWKKDLMIACLVMTETAETQETIISVEMQMDQILHLFMKIARIREI